MRGKWGVDLVQRMRCGLISASCLHRDSPLFPARSGAPVARWWRDGMLGLYTPHLLCGLCLSLTDPRHRAPPCRGKSYQPSWKTLNNEAESTDADINHGI